MDTIINPQTKRHIQRGGKLHISLVRKGILKTETLGEHSLKYLSVKPTKKESFQSLLKQRDPLYFRRIKRIVPRMPDIRGFKSVEAQASLTPWTIEKRYEALLQDLETLDSASSFGRDNDLKLIEAMNEKDDEKDWGKWYNFSNKEKELLKNQYNAAEFIASYPALSWIMILTIPSFRLWALKYSSPSYQEWVKDVNMREDERITVAEFITDSELLNIVLGPIKLDDNNNYPTYNLLNIASECNNRVLLRYLAINGPQPNRKSVLFFIRGGDVEALKIVLSHKEDNITEKQVIQCIDEAIASGSIPMLEFIRDIHSELIDQNELDSHIIRNVLDNNNILLIQWIEKRGHVFSPKEMIEATTLSCIEPTTIDYLFDSYAINPFLLYEINNNSKESAFMHATGNPRILQHLINKYGALATEEDWNNTLRASKENYEYWREDSAYHVQLYQESINIIEKSHSFL